MRVIAIGLLLTLTVINMYGYAILEHINHVHDHLLTIEANCVAVPVESEK